MAGAGGPSSTWKSVERRICRVFGLERNPGSGSNGGAGSCGDCLVPELGKPRGWLYVEVKHMAKAAIFTLWKDTVNKATNEKRIPIVVQHEKGTQRYLATVDLDTLAQLIDIADDKGKLALSGLEG